MATIENVSGTAFVVAEFRAEENTQPAPLYTDPIVGLFLNDDSKRAAERVAASFPPTRDLVRIRTRYLDDMLDKQLRSNVRQVVILGAGLDTRAVRKHSAAVSYTRQVLAQLKNHVRRFELSFDYMTESVVSKTTGDPAITSLVESFARMGAPWVSGIGNIHTLAHEAGLKVVENFRTAELYRRYWPGRPMTSPIFNFYSVCTLGSDRA